MYDYNMILKKTSNKEWSILSDKGVVVHVLTRCDSQLEAETAMRIWASSWISMKVEIEDEQQEK